MMEGIVPPEQLALLRPEAVSPAVVVLASEQAPTRAILCAGAGGFELAHVTLTQGVFLPDTPNAADDLLAKWDELADRKDEHIPEFGFFQSRCELKKAGYEFPDDDAG
jgi:hypothetical protein